MSLRAACTQALTCSTLWAALAGGLAQAVPAARCAEETSRKSGGRAERRAEIERQIQRLRSECWAEREAAGEQLRSYGAEILPHLSGLASDADTEFSLRVRALQRNAQLALGGLGEKIGALLLDYANLTPPQRAKTVQAVVQAGHALSVPLLLNLLDSESDQLVQEAILSQLGWLNTGLDGLKPLLKFYARSPEGLKASVLWALAGIPSPESRTLVREALQEESTELRSAAVRSVLRLGDRESLPVLRRLAAGGNEIVDELKLEALEALTGLYDEEAGPIFREALAGPHALQLAGLKGIAGLRDRSIAPCLIALFRDEARKNVREEVVAAMGAVGAPAFLPLLEESLKREPPALRIAALEALRLMDAKSSAPAIAACLEDGDRDVRKAALRAVASLGCRETLGKLKELLAEPDPEISFLAAKALANLGESAGLAHIVETAKAFALGIEQGGDLRRTTYEAVRLIGQWQIESGRPILEAVIPHDDENDAVQAARFKFTFDADAFRALLKQRLTRHLAAPKNIDAAFYLSALFRQRGLDDQAIELLEGLARRTPNQVTILDRLASAYREAGRYPECEAAFDRLQAIAGTSATYLNNRAWFYCTAFKKDFLRPEKALTLVRRAVAMEPRNTYYVDTLGWALHTAGRHAEAAVELHRAMELKEGADRPGRAWQKTRIARSLWAAGRKDEALAEVEQALAQAPRDARVWVEAAGFYAAAGRRDDAVHALHLVVDLGWIQAPPLELNREFDSLRQDPGYSSALQRVRRARAAVERLVAEVDAEIRKSLAAKPPAEEDAASPEADAGELFILED